MRAYNNQGRLKKKTETGEQILESAIRFFGEYGYNNAVVSQIAKAAGVAHGAVFQHYESKERLLAAALRYVVLKTFLVPEEACSFQERLVRLIQQTIQLKKEKEEHYRFLKMIVYSTELPDSFWEARRDLFYESQLAGYMKTAQEAGDIPQGELYGYFRIFFMMVFNVIGLYEDFSIYPKGETAAFVRLMEFVITQVDKEET